MEATVSICLASRPLTSLSKAESHTVVRCPGDPERLGTEGLTPIYFWNIDYRHLRAFFVYESQPAGTVRIDGVGTVFTGDPAVSGGILMYPDSFRVQGNNVVRTWNFEYEMTLVTLTF
jgi:hypothetical protein